jgi:hypothetical protein
MAQRTFHFAAVLICSIAVTSSAQTPARTKPVRETCIVTPRIETITIEKNVLLRPGPERSSRERAVVLRSSRDRSAPQTAQIEKALVQTAELENCLYPPAKEKSVVQAEFPVAPRSKVKPSRSQFTSQVSIPQPSPPVPKKPSPPRELKYW